MTKEIHAILPDYAYEITLDIIKNHNLSEREKSISEQLRNSSDPEINKSLIDDKPSMILALIAKKAAIEKLSEEEITSFLAEKLRLDKERAEHLMIELKKKLIFFIEVIKIDNESDSEETSPENKGTDNIIEEDVKKESGGKKDKKERRDDPYREPIE